MLFTEEENKNEPCGQQEENHIRQQAAPYAGRARNLSLSSPGQHLHKVSRFKLPVSGVPGKAPSPRLPLRAPRIDKKPFVPPIGHEGESAQRQGQTLQGYLTPGP